MKDKLTRRELLQASAVAGAGAVLAAVTPAMPALAAPARRPASQKNIKLTLWIADRRTINDMTTNVMKSEFQNANPNLTVEVNFIPEGDIPAKMATSMKANLMPNVSALDESQVPGLMKQGFLKPIPADVFDVAKMMGPKAAAFYKIPPGPAYYALPNGNMPCVMYVNLDLLTKLGYKLEQIPNKWDDFVKWAQSVTVWKGDEITQWGFTFAGTPWFWDSVGYQNGGWLFQNSKKSSLNDPVMVDAYQFTVDLMDKFKLDFRTAPTTAENRVGQGLAVTGVNFGFAYGTFKTIYPKVNFATLPLPTRTGKPPYGRASDDLGFCITTQAKDQDTLDATYTLFEYLLSPAYQRRYVVLRGLQPSLLSLNTESQFTEKNVEWAGIAKICTPGNFRADGVWPAECTPLMHQDAYERIMNKKEPIKAVLDDHAAKIDKILAAAGDLPLLTGKDGWKAEWEKPL
jgi:ABC-type glycerol-3-phosphate transport system substrate-binding protein